jgi:putative hydrolase of HD superfamily
MKNILDFLIEVGKLKKMPRMGWVINQIKNPESIADHVFRSTIMGWILGGEKGGLKIEELLKMSLIHDLCEIYAGDETPYSSILPKDKRKLRELMKVWPRFSNAARQKIIQKKHQREERAFKRLTFKLPLDFKKEIEGLWLRYEERLTPEGRFFHQADRMENFLQAYEYWKKYRNPPLGPWWLWAREFFDDLLLVKFMEVLGKKFHHEKIQKQLKSSLNLLNFFSEIGKLKRMPRRGWVSRGVKNPESISAHSFRLAIMAWVFGKKTPGLNSEKIIKLALVHDLTKVYAVDTTPYDKILVRKEDFKRLKKGIFYRDYKNESIALNKLDVKLPNCLKKELIACWNDYQRGLSKEGKFIRQVSRIENLLQALEYWKKNKNFPIEPWWEEARQLIKEPVLAEFMKTLEEKFVGDKKDKTFY